MAFRSEKGTPDKGDPGAPFRKKKPRCRCRTAERRPWAAFLTNDLVHSTWSTAMGPIHPHRPVSIVGSTGTSTAPVFLPVCRHDLRGEADISVLLPSSRLRRHPIILQA